MACLRSKIETSFVPGYNRHRCPTVSPLMRTRPPSCTPVPSDLARGDRRPASTNVPPCFGATFLIEAFSERAAGPMELTVLGV